MNLNNDKVNRKKRVDIVNNQTGEYSTKIINNNEKEVVLLLEGGQVRGVYDS